MGWLPAWPFSTTERTQRIAIYEVSYEAFLGLLQLDGTFALKMEGIPEGAQLVFAEADNRRGIMQLYVEHESFPRQCEGSALHTIGPVTSTRYDLPATVIAERKDS